MNKQIVAKVKFSKDGRIYNFLVKDNIKIAKLKKEIAEIPKAKKAEFIRLETEAMNTRVGLWKRYPDIMECIRK